MILDIRNNINAKNIDSNDIDLQKIKLNNLTIVHAYNSNLSGSALISILKHGSDLEELHVDLCKNLSEATENHLKGINLNNLKKFTFDSSTLSAATAAAIICKSKFLQKDVNLILKCAKHFKIYHPSVGFIVNLIVTGLANNKWWHINEYDMYDLIASHAFSAIHKHKLLKAWLTDARIEKNATAPEFLLGIIEAYYADKMLFDINANKEKVIKPIFHHMHPQNILGFLYDKNNEDEGTESAANKIYTEFKKQTLYEIKKDQVTASKYRIISNKC